MNLCIRAMLADRLVGIGRDCCGTCKIGTPMIVYSASSARKQQQRIDDVGGKF
jgi:hypothetical protein